jgi:hypothetical protein
MQTIQSLTSELSRQQIISLKMAEMKGWIESHWEVEQELSKILPVYSVTTFCECV